MEIRDKFGRCFLFDTERSMLMSDDLIIYLNEFEKNYLKENLELNELDNLFFELEVLNG